MEAVLGTAGHIDHGKTSLVRALTGINCDRLDEERRRGITIELGFAWLDLPAGGRLGIVDVPGHERFVKNMVAGAAGIDFVMLVIAADEGIMPQTREHLDICAMLGIRQGLVALTKIDMVEPDWLELAREDITSSLAGTFLENAPIIPVSSTTGEGMAELRARIFELAANLEPRPGAGIPRLPVDRVFSLKGFGTVVTGTLVSGAFCQGENLRVEPGGKMARARTLQVHGQDVKEARQGQRCAINFQGLEVEDIQRGDVITTPDSLFPSQRWLARLTCLPSAPAPIRQRMEAHFHHQARECAAKIIFFDRMELKPGETAIAELRFDQPLPGVFGDHFVIRANSPLRAIAGGIVLDPLPEILRQRDPLFSQKLAVLESLANLTDKSPWAAPRHKPREIIKMALAMRGLPGADAKRLAVLTGLKNDELAQNLADMAGDGEILNWDATSGWWIGMDAVTRILAKLAARGEDLHEREPLKSSFSPLALYSALENSLPPKFLQKILEVGIERGIFQMEGNGIRLASWRVTLDDAQKGIVANLLEIYANCGFTPPLLKEVGEKLGEDAKSILAALAHLCETGKLVKIQDGLYYDKAVLDKILERIRAWFQEHDNLDVGAMKAMFAVSRKFAIPLLEYLDSIKITYRVGDKRQLRK